MELIGQRFGRFVIKCRAEPGRNGRSADERVICSCDCGSTKVVRLRHLRRGASQSCGCLRTERSVAALTIHGEAREGQVTSEHRIWRKMLGRCHCLTDKAFSYYGARGIVVCDRWRKSYVNFLADMGHRPSIKHSIERIDNDGPYSPENCKWATRMEQARNKRTSVVLTFNGTTRHVMEWADVIGITAKEIRRRLSRGWTVERALTQPPYATRRQRHGFLRTQTK